MPIISPTFYADAMNKADYRKRGWYYKNIHNVLAAAKEKQAREIDASIAMADQLIKILDEKIRPPAPAPVPKDIVLEDINMMKPLSQEELDLIYKSSEKGSTEAYFKARSKKSPEDKYFTKITTSMDYGWQQKMSIQRPRDVNHGRCAILRDTFYRKNNLAADPRHYGYPSGGEFSICSQYSCDFN